MKPHRLLSILALSACLVLPAFAAHAVEKSKVNVTHEQTAPDRPDTAPGVAEVRPLSLDSFAVYLHDTGLAVFAMHKISAPDYLPLLCPDALDALHSPTGYTLTARYRYERTGPGVHLASYVKLYQRDRQGRTEGDESGTGSGKRATARSTC